MRNQNYACDVIVNNKPIREFNSSYSGTGYTSCCSTLVEGRKGSRFSIRVRNFSGDRIVAVVAIEGLSVLDGKPLETPYSGNNSRGYVIGPYSSYDIKGWRKDYDNVAEFYFSDIGKSYAVRTDQEDSAHKHSGEIKVWIFKEEPPAVRWVNISPCTYTVPQIPYTPTPYYPSGEDHWVYSNTNGVTGDNLVGTYTTSWDGGNGVTLTGSSSETLSGSSGTTSRSSYCSTLLPPGGSVVNDSNLHSDLGAGYGQNAVDHVHDISMGIENVPSAEFTIRYGTREFVRECIRLSEHYGGTGSVVRTKFCPRPR